MQLIKIILILIIFALLLYFVYSSYTEEVVVNEKYVLVSRDGNFALGLAATILGFVLFIYLLFLSLKFAINKKSIWQWFTLLILSTLVFVLAYFVPAKSLGYLALISLPFGVLLFVISWIILLSKSWNKMKDNKTYFYVVLIGTGIVLGASIYYSIVYMISVLKECCP